MAVSLCSTANALVQSAGNPACWSGALNAERCCDVARAPTGDASCWAGSVDFSFCCPAPEPGGAGTPPGGWVLCDGANGTPDLRDKFVVGAGDRYPVGTNASTGQLLGPTTRSQIISSANNPAAPWSSAAGPNRGCRGCTTVCCCAGHTSDRPHRLVQSISSSVHCHWIGAG